MARSIGIDLGSYSVKVVMASTGFRQSSVVEFFERPVPAGDEKDSLERAAAVAGEILREHASDQDSLFVAVSGDFVHARVLEFGFKGLKRADLEKAVGSELEGLLPFDLDELVFDFDTLPRDLGVDPAAEAKAPQREVDEDDEPTFVQGTPETSPLHGPVAAPAPGMRVFACAMNVERARDLLDLIAQHGEEPRGLIVGSAAYARVVERVGALSPSQSRGDPVAVIDMGHSRTDVCVVKGGRVVFARTIVRGGRDVTAAIAKAFRMSDEEAERAKHADGFIGSQAEPPPSDAWRRIHEVVYAELEPAARELRRTLTACRAETGALVSAAVIAGGGSRLRGLPSFLSEQLDLPVSTFGAEDTERIVGADLAASGVPADVAAMAAGVAFEGATGRPNFDLRRGALAYKADFGFLRQKAAHLAALALVVIAFAAGNAYLSLHKLRKAETALTERVAIESTQVFGRQMEAWEVLEAVGPQRIQAASPMPKMTAWDVLNEVNGKLPPKEDVTIDVKEIDIRPGKVNIQAQVASSEQIDAIEKKLKTIECFQTISRGNIAEGPAGVKNFSLAISANCQQE